MCLSWLLCSPRAVQTEERLCTGMSGPKQESEVPVQYHGMAVPADLG